jgi:hypothetical protein
LSVLDLVTMVLGETSEIASGAWELQCLLALRWGGGLTYLLNIVPYQPFYEETVQFTQKAFQGSHTILTSGPTWLSQASQHENLHNFPGTSTPKLAYVCFSTDTFVLTLARSKRPASSCDSIYGTVLSGAHSIHCDTLAARWHLSLSPKRNALMILIASMEMCYVPLQSIATLALDDCDSFYGNALRAASIHCNSSTTSTSPSFTLQIMSLWLP